MFKSIRTRLIGTYLVIIIATVLTIAIILSFWVRNYYKDNIESYLKGQLEVVSVFYQNYFSGSDLSQNSRKIIKNFSNMTVQIQIIDASGMVIDELVDSGKKDLSKETDVTAALSDKTGKYEWVNKATNEPTLAYSMPLKNGKDIVGVIRFVTSLTETNRVLNNYYLYIFILSIAIIGLVFLISLFLSRTIVNPIIEITRTANEMSKGNINAKAKKIYDDEIGRLADTLNYLWSELQKNQKLKNEFISAVSHELRTPITSIKGWAITLKETDAENIDEIRHGLDIIDSEADRFKDMIEELLDFSRLESGRFEIYKNTVNIRTLILSVFEQMKPRAERQKINMNLNFNTVYDMVSIDERRIRQVLINVIDNALRYTKEEEGKISIETNVVLENKSQFYKINIIDNGCGIDETELVFVKQKFYRGKDNDKTTGTGIGLAVCEDIINLHSGTIRVISKIGEGADVEILLPLDC
ncbi:MAG TPA: two-component sensor histidine kinase [Clostridiales bacterium]|nr:MAG: hypothetical protein A2Y18_03530 [Clostridiales bacterium GWD2_32_19]HCC07803.1 two-component sensor histidine kinase [Clostridiales bacterium]